MLLINQLPLLVVQFLLTYLQSIHIHQHYDGSASLSMLIVRQAIPLLHVVLPVQLFVVIVLLYTLILNIPI